MRISKHVLIIHSVAFLAALIALSLGIYGGQPIYFVVSLWVSALTAISASLFILRGYRRLMIRLGTTNKRLSELRFLQERRYEQLRQRLDSLLTHSNDMHTRNTSDSGQTNTAQQHYTESLLLSELENLNARLQRSERRILGTIAADQLNDDLYQRRLEQLMSHQSLSHDN